jgi:hypothetical protein
MLARGRDFDRQLVAAAIAAHAVWVDGVYRTEKREFEFLA